MKEYLGEIDVTDQSNPYSQYTSKDWALYFIQRYGSIDGSDHKNWVLDQVARVLNGCNVQVKLAQWGDLILNGENSQKIVQQEEYRCKVIFESDEYLEFVRNCKDGEDGPETYGYEVGTAP